jgi:two-component system OmpR family response regulator
VRILIVEDDAKIAQYLRKGLGEAGYRVDHLGSAEEALGAASLNSYDALVVDLMLPGKDGRWLLEQLRDRDSGRSTGSAARSITSLAEGDIEVDLLSRTVRRQGTTVELQPREFSLLEFFLRHPGQVLTKTMILEHVWSYDFDPQTNVVDVLVSRLRSKIDRDFEPKVIHTVRGVGYAYRPEGE